MDFCRLNDTVYFNVTLHNISGVRKHGDENPVFWVIRQSNDTPVVANSGMSTVINPVGNGWSGVYKGKFTSAQGSWFLDEFYSVLVSGKVDGLTAFHTPFEFLLVSGLYDNIIRQMPTTTGTAYDVWEEKTANHPRGGTFGSGVNIASGQWAYFADLRFTKDTTNDEYTVDWYRNTTPVPSSEITTPQLQVIKRVDGTNLIAATTMDFISINIGTVKLNEGSNRMTDGEAAIAKATAVIDGATRTWVKLIGRDV